jgi:hypothetical protein
MDEHLSAAKVNPVATQETGAGRADGTEEARIGTNGQKDER